MLNPNTDRQRQELANRLKTAIEGSGYSKIEVAKLCDVSSQAVTGWIQTGRISRESLLKVSNVTGYEVDWLITGEGIQKISNSFKGIDASEVFRFGAPLISWANAGDFTEAGYVFSEDSEFYPRPPNASSSTYVLKVEGESMLPEYPPGSLIFVDPERAAVNGDDVIAVLDDTGEATFKRYIEEPGAGKMLKSLNPLWPKPYIPITSNCTIAGVIVADMRIR